MFGVILPCQINVWPLLAPTVSEGGDPYASLHRRHYNKSTTASHTTILNTVVSTDVARHFQHRRLAGTFTGHRSCPAGHESIMSVESSNEVIRLMFLEERTRSLVVSGQVSSDPHQCSDGSRRSGYHDESQERTKVDM